MSKDKTLLNSYHVSAIDTIKNISTLKKSRKLEGCTSTLEEQDYNSLLFNTALSMTSTNQLLFRKRAETDNSLVSSWLSLVTNKAILSELANKGNVFSTLKQNDLTDIVALSNDPKTLTELKNFLLVKYGIHLVYERSIPGLKTDGCVFLLNNKIPVIGLSLRYSRYDYFWFTLMHELSHIHLHIDKLSTPIIDSLYDNNDEESDIEIEANTIAQNSLIPRNIQRNLVRYVNGSATNLKRISHQTGIHTAILAGSIRNKTKNYSIFSKEINFMDVREVILSNETLHTLSQS